MEAGGLMVCFVPEQRVVLTVVWLDMIYTISDNRASIVKVQLAYLVSRLR